MSFSLQQTGSNLQGAELHVPEIEKRTVAGLTLPRYVQALARKPKLLGDLGASQVKAGKARTAHVE